MKKYRRKIHQMTIESNYPYIVYGSVRGLVSEHRKITVAEKALGRDQRNCASLGNSSYSDCNVFDMETGLEVGTCFDLEDLI